MNSFCYSLTEIQRQIDEVIRFLSVTLSIANAHTVEFYTHDVWKQFMAVTPEEVLSAVSSSGDQQREPHHKGTRKQTGGEKRLLEMPHCDEIKAKVIYGVLFRLEKPAIQFFYFLYLFPSVKASNISIYKMRKQSVTSDTFLFSSH